MEVSKQKYKQILAYLNNELAGAELKEFESWLNHSDKNKVAVREVQRKMLLTRWTLQSTLIDKESDYNKISAKLTPRVRPLYVWVVAASIIIVFGLSVPYFWESQTNFPDLNSIAAIQPDAKSAELILSNGERISLAEQGKQITETDGSLILLDSARCLDYKTNESPESIEIFNTLKVSRGNEYNIRLADGTQVWLNSDSELRYPVSFYGDKREVYLKGEAYFEVKEDKNHPFVVNTIFTNITVLGTGFNVRSYKDELEATTLVHGKVEVSDKNNNSVVLSPGEQAIIEKNSIKVAKVETSDYTAWKDGYFVFKNTSIDVILTQLTRWYDFEYTYQNDDTSNYLLTTKLKRFDSFQEIINILEETDVIEFELEGKSLIVKSK